MCASLRLSDPGSSRRFCFRASCRFSAGSGCPQPSSCFQMSPLYGAVFVVSFSRCAVKAHHMSPSSDHACCTWSSETTTNLAEPPRLNTALVRWPVSSSDFRAICAHSCLFIWPRLVLAMGWTRVEPRMGLKSRLRGLASFAVLFRSA